MEFILGCNYWASNAGTEMWRQFDKKTIEKDLSTLSQYGVKYMRVFPIWRDFQPVMPVYKGNGTIMEYQLENDVESKNPYYIDEIMMERFEIFLSSCKKHNIKVIVGLITGCMSGRLFIPSALYDKNVLTDPLAIHFQTLFVKGFVSYFKNNKTIFAWDLGNECNCMAECSNIEALNWTSIISNAIRAEDNTRSVISGMHTLNVDKNKPWRIKDQALFNDILTTHPHPVWCNHTRVENVLSFRTLLHATAENKLYSELGEKPCFTEEICAQGPMICSDENDANFLRVNLFSLWANKSLGLMWWCAHEQTKLTSFPYSKNEDETELGLLDINHNPKPVILEMDKFDKFLKSIDFEIPEAKIDATCLLTENQRQWGIGYMTYAMLKKIGLNLKFAFTDNKLPESDIYIVPSINSRACMNKKLYAKLKEKAYSGKDVLISLDTGVLSEFEAFTGLMVVDSNDSPTSTSMTFENEKISIRKRRNYIMKPTTAKVLAYDEDNNVAVSVNNYGKGRVIVVNFPLENNMVDEQGAFDKYYHLIYKKVFENYIENSEVKVLGEKVVYTYHKSENNMYIVALNNSDTKQNIKIETDKKYIFEKAYYGDKDAINAYDACVLKYKLS